MIMKEIHNPVFDIVPAPAKKQPYAWSVMFKGKKYREEILSFYGGEASANMSAEEFLDFDAVHLPKGFDFNIWFTPEHDMNFLHDLSLIRKGKFIKMSFGFGLKEEHFFEMDLNPLKLLHQFIEAAAEIGYKTEVSTIDNLEDHAFYAEVKVPVQGNLYDHFQKHVAVFEDLMQQAQREALVRVRKGSVK